jgi:transposase
LENEDREGVRRFYQQFQQAVVGVEALGYAGWFHRLIEELGQALLVGDAQEIRRRARRRHKNDHRDAMLILDLLLHEDFPEIYHLSPASQQVLGLLRYRHRLVKMQTMLKNGVQAVALNEGLRLKSNLWTEAGRQRLAALELEAAGAWQRETSLAMLGELGKQIERTEGELQKRAQGDECVLRLQTHPGVGLLTPLAVVHLLGPTKRFAGPAKWPPTAGSIPASRAAGITSDSDTSASRAVGWCGSCWARRRCQPWRETTNCGLSTTACSSTGTSTRGWPSPPPPGSF